VAITKKVSAGSVLPIEQSKAEIVVQNDSLKLAAAQNRLRQAKIHLAALWGGDPRDVGALQDPSGVARLEKLLDQHSLEKSPQLRLARATTEYQKKRVAVEKSEAIPNASVGIGMKRLEETETTALIGNFSIALPVFDRNQAGIRSAIANTTASALLEQDEQNRLQEELAAMRLDLATLLSEYRAIEENVLPQAESAYSDAYVAHSRGRLSLLDLLDTRRLLIEAQERQQAVRQQAYELGASLQALTGNYSLTSEEDAP
ncbi:MAG: TolC family protein, partial [Bdellovibrionales bacterium]|nr:TolC family protein [Bdellovibrionales bacterium]